MAENAWPFYGAETTETQFSKWARRLGESGIASGLALTAPGGMVVRAGIGEALLRGLFYENTSTKDLAVGAAPSAGNTRLDGVVLKLDQDANTIQTILKAGTANGTGGILPALTQTETIWEMLYGVVTVASGTVAITSGMISELRPSIGERVLIGTTARKPAASAAGEAVFFNTTTGQIEYSDGTTWTALITTANLTGTLGADKGGTGVTTLKAAREALDIFVQPGAPAHKKGRIWINGPALD